MIDDNKNENSTLDDNLNNNDLNTDEKSILVQTNDQDSDNIIDEEDIKEMKKQWIYYTLAICVFVGCIVWIASASLTYYLTLKKRK